MNPLRRYRWSTAAHRDAGNDVDAVEARIIAELGPRPAFDPANNHRHAQVADDLRKGADIENWGDDLRRLEDAYARETSPLVYLILIAFLFVGEAIGGVLLMKSLGLENPERLIFGLMFAVAVIFITGALAARANAGPAGGAPTSTPARAIATLAVLLIYSGLMIGVAVVRLNAGEEETSIGEMIVLVAMTVLPAWLAEWAIRRRAPARILKRQMRLLKGRLRRARRTYERAQRFVAQSAEAQRRWDVEAARLRALYQTEYRLARASAEPDDDDEPTNERNPTTRR